MKNTHCETVVKQKILPLLLYGLRWLQKSFTVAAIPIDPTFWWWLGKNQATTRPHKPTTFGETMLTVHRFDLMTFCATPHQSIAPSLYPLLPLSSTRPSNLLCPCQSQLLQQHWCLSILGECRHTPKLLNGQAKNSSGWIWLGWFMRLWVIQLCRCVRRARE